MEEGWGCYFGGVWRTGGAVDGSAVVLDLFNPVREDYARRENEYFPTIQREEMGTGPILDTLP